VEVEDYWDGVYGGWRAVLAEMLGTMMYVFASAGVAIATNTFDFKEADYHRSLLILAFGDGLAFTCFVFAFMRLSGGHLNPTITWAAIITRRIGFMKGIAYILAQVGGGLLGALMISAATPDNYHGRLGSPFWDASLSNFDGFLLITTLCGCLVMVVFSCQLDPQHIGKLAPLPIGLTVIFADLVGYVFVGPFLNPARALSTAIVYGSYGNMWVYWAAPAVGSTIAALLYALLFLTRSFPATAEVAFTAETPKTYSHYATVVPTETTRLVGTPTV
jgi:MIP family channel proteins